ncbi:alpha/beta-hydrolase [Hypoxylon crocopeplum]|nr:alpha/beta-hydrolase [Hypoxylon crocopeplum]
MADQKPVLVFSPGAWHTPEYFEPTTTLLCQEGYTCDLVWLPSVGAELRSPDDMSIPQDFAPDVAAIRNTVLKHLDAGLDVVLVVHSYSGVVGSEAVAGLDTASRSAAGKPTSVTRLVYVAALVIEAGTQRLWTNGGPNFPDQVRVHRDLVYCRPEKVDEVFYSRCTPQQRSWIVQTCLRSHAKGVFLSPVTHAAWRVIPGTYVKPAADPVIKFIANFPDGHRFDDVVEMGGDHFPFVSAAEEMAEVIMRAAEKSVVGRA